MLRPILFLGLGGAGSQTVRSIRRAIEEQLGSAGWDAGIPSAFQFLGVDLERDGDSSFAHHDSQLKDSEFHSLMQLGSNFASAQDTLETLCATEDMKADLLSWVYEPHPAVVFPYLGVRNIGRLALFGGMRSFCGHLQLSVEKMQSNMAADELRSLSDHLNLQQAASTILEPRVVIISSVCGATGSGIYSDVLEVLRRLYPDSALGFMPISFLYTAEVYKQLPSLSFACCRRNMFATLRDISTISIAGTCSQTDKLFELCGVPSKAEDYRDTSAKVLISPVGDVGDPSDLYMIVGTKLAEVVLDKVKSEGLFDSPFNAEKFDLSPTGLTDRVEQFSTTVFSSICSDKDSFRHKYCYETSQSSRELSRWGRQLLAEKSEASRYALSQSAWLSRPLRESIPLNDSDLLAWLCGFTIAWSLGLFDGFSEAKPERLVVWSPDELRHLEFPFERSLLASVGRAYTCALLLNYGFAVNIRDTEAHTYLIGLGSEVTEPASKRGRESRFLSNWMLGTEKRSLPNRNLPIGIGTNSPATFDERREALLTHLDGRTAALRTFIAEMQELPWNHRPLTWEMRTEILHAIGIVRSYVFNVDAGEKSTPSSRMQGQESHSSVRLPIAPKLEDVGETYSSDGFRKFGGWLMWISLISISSHLFRRH